MPTVPDGWNFQLTAKKNELHVGLGIPKPISIEIHNWAEEQDWPEGTDLEPIEEYQITMLYAPEGHDEKDGLDLDHDSHAVSIKGITSFPSSEREGQDAIVLLVESETIQGHHDDLADEAEDSGIDISPFSHDDFKPHITIAYGSLPKGLKTPELTFETEVSEISPPRTEKEGAWEDDDEHENWLNMEPSAYDFDRPEGDPYRAYVYHSAPTEDRERIRTHGLIPSLPEHNPQWEHPDDATDGSEVRGQPEGVYVSRFPGDFPYTKPTDIWRARVNPDDLDHDPMWEEDEPGKHFVHWKAIPPQDVELHEPHESGGSWQMHPQANRAPYMASLVRFTDSWTPKDQWPNALRERNGEPVDVDCTCKDGHKLDCPVHGMHPTLPTYDDTLDFPDPNNPAGYDYHADAPRTWMRAETKVAMVPMGFDYMYHVSPSGNRDRILSEGLMGHKRLEDDMASPISYGPEMQQPPGNYLFPHLNDAVSYSASHELGDIYRVDARGLPIFPDPENRMYEGTSNLGDIADPWGEGERSFDEDHEAWASTPSRYVTPTHVHPSRLSLLPEGEGEESQEGEFQTIWDMLPYTERPTPGHEAKKTAAKRYLDWQPGQWGKGIITPQGDIHTWETNEADGYPTHSEYVEDQGLTSQDITVPFEIHPKGIVRTFYGRPHDSPEIFAADPRLRPEPAGEQGEYEWHFGPITGSANKKLWVDDTRRPPDDSWDWARDVREAKRLTKKNSYKHMSLDHDLGILQYEGKVVTNPDALSGGDFAIWLHEHRKHMPKSVNIHSHNGRGADLMKDILDKHTKVTTDRAPDDLEEDWAREFKVHEPSEIEKERVDLPKRTASHQLAWLPGSNLKGKGLVTPNGDVHTWPVDKEGFPHHAEYVDQRQPYQLGEGKAHFFQIRPRGGLDTEGYRVPANVIHHILQTVPSLRAGERTDWHFAAGSPQTIIGPIRAIVDAQGNVHTFNDGHAPYSESNGIDPATNLAHLQVHQPSGEIEDLSGAHSPYEQQVVEYLRRATGEDRYHAMSNDTAWDFLATRKVADQWDTREYPDTRMMPPTTMQEPAQGNPHPEKQGCTCEEGHKLDCPVHGLNPTEEDSDHSWSIPEGHPVGYPQDQPRNYMKAEGAWRIAAVDPKWLSRWIKERGPYVYHGSNEDYDEAIARHGLLPWNHLPDYKPGPSEVGIGQPRPDHIYMTTSAPDPYDYSRIYKVDLRKLDPHNLNPDEDWYADSYDAPRVDSTSGQRAEELRLGDDPTHTQGSMEWGKLAHRGPIPLQAISIHEPPKPEGWSGWTGLPRAEGAVEDEDEHEDNLEGENVSVPKPPVDIRKKRKEREDLELVRGSSLLHSAA
jgi:hypothetical protein